MTLSSKSGAEVEAVCATVNDYLDGTFYADEVKIRRAFHPACLQFGMYQGELLSDTVDKYVDWLKASEALPAGTAYDAQIISVDVTGDIAAVTLVAIFNNSKYTDYLTLVNGVEGWSIVSKTFHEHAEQ